MPKRTNPFSSQVPSSHASLVDARQQGLKAFHANNFDAAIAAWSCVRDHDATVRAALAEAYFRRALTKTAIRDQIDDLNRSLVLVPNEPRYAYHLGLAHHRCGEWSAAIECYQAVIEQPFLWSGVGFVLALALLERDPQGVRATLPERSPMVCAEVAPIEALLQGRAPVLPNRSGTDAMTWIKDQLERSSPPTPSPIVWYGLGLIQQRDPSTRAFFAQPFYLPSARAQAIHRFYSGVAAAQASDMDRALSMWLCAHEEGVRTPWLLDNLALLLGQRLQEQLDADDLASLAGTVQQAVTLSLDHPALKHLLVHALDTLAHAAAVEGAWEEAILRWEKARTIVTSSANLGSARPILHNLALAYEALEDWLQAARTWRGMLRSRPRKNARAKSASELTDEQWAWVRKRVIECYQRAGRPDEAVTVFRQAIKANPTDLELRIQLADALLANDQEQASYNELQRILQQDPSHLEAHLRLAHLYTDWGEWEKAEQSFRIVLAAQPERDDIRRQVARLLLTRGSYLHSSRRYAEARQVFEEGQELVPDEYQFPLNLARLAVDEQRLPEAQTLLERTLELAADQPDAYVLVIECWVVANKLDEVYAVLKRAETTLVLSADFYVNLGVMLINRSMPPPPISLSLDELTTSQKRQPANKLWSQMGMEAIARAVRMRPDDVQLHVLIASELKLIHPELALHHAKAALELKPDEPTILLLLGLVQGLNEQSREAKETLHRAAHLARKQGDHDLAEQAEVLRRQIGNPLFRVTLQIRQLFGDDVDPDDLFM